MEALEALRDIKRWNATYKSGVGVVYVESLNGGLVRYRDLLDRSATLHSAGSDAAQGVAVRALEWEPEGDDDEVADGAAGRYWTALVGVSYRLIFISQCGDSLTQSVLAEGLGFEKAKVMAEEHHRRCVLDWITSSQSARGQDKAGLDNRACIFCGRPAHEHPWIDHPKRGRVRGDCPMDKSAAAPPSEATVGEVAARALISRATPCGERP